MIAPHHDRRLDLSLLHQVIKRQAELRALSITKPADATRQSLELDPLAREANPTAKNFVVGKHFQHQIVGSVNVRGIAGKRRPAEGSATFAEQRTNVCRHKSRKIVGVLYAVFEGKRANIVAVIESH